ncbi:inactive receptor partial [Nannochloropsis oceanica]
MVETTKKAFRLLTVNGDQQEYICPLHLETGRHTSISDSSFIVSQYKRENVDTKTLPAIEVGVSKNATENEKQHYVGFCKYLGHGLKGTSLPKYAEIRLPQSRNLCVWLCPPPDPSSFQATSKLKLLIPPVLLSAYTFSPPSSPLPSPVSAARAAGAKTGTPTEICADVAAAAAGKFAGPPDEDYDEFGFQATFTTPGAAAASIAVPSPPAAAVSATIPPPPPPLAAAASLPFPPLPCNSTTTTSSSSTNSSFSSSFMQVDKSILSTLSQNHVWLFGALAELLHNSSDAGSTDLQIHVREEERKENGKGVMVLEIKDNGEGMSHGEMEAMFRLGKTYARDQDDNLQAQRVGRYGWGFKQGSLRIGSTAVVITKSLKHKTLSFGILSNEPHLREENAAPVCRVVTLSADTMEPDPAHTSREAFREASALMARYSFVTHKRLWPLMLNTWGAGESGTTIFIQGIERLDPESGKLWRELKVDRANADLLLVNRGGKKHLNTRGALLAESVPIDHSLRAYLKVAFLHHRMSLSLLGKAVQTPNLVDSLSDIRRYNLLRDEPHQKPVIVTVGKSHEARRLGLGGAMFYSTNVLISSYVRQEIGITNPREGMGVLAVVHLDPRQYATQHSKQSFRRPNPALEKIEERLGRVWTHYIMRETAQRAVVHEGVAASMLVNNMKTALTDSIQCEHCGKWRVVSQAYVAGFAGEDVKWYCWSEGSPVANCEAPEAASMQDEREVLVEFKAGSQADYLVAMGEEGEKKWNGGDVGHGSVDDRKKKIKNSCGARMQQHYENEYEAESKEERKQRKREEKERRRLEEEEEEQKARARKKRRKHHRQHEESNEANKPRFLVSRDDCTLLKLLSAPHLSLVKLSGKRKVVLKNVALSRKVEARAAFREELKKLRRLTHENLVPVIAARIEDETGGFSAVGYAFQEGLVDLGVVLLKPHTIVTLEDRLLTACKVAAALDHLHHKGLVHGALRPTNVLVSFPSPKLRTVKLTDHGIGHRALMVAGPGGNGSAERIAFTAPEVQDLIISTAGGKATQMTGDAAAADIWSMGILLLELMVGRKAWGVAKTATELKKLVADFSLASFPGLRHLESLMRRQVGVGEWEDRLEDIKGLAEACLRRKASERLSSQQLVGKLSCLSAGVLFHV